MIKSADRKPEKYVGPDGKPKIRMVPVDKEVVKSEGGMKRIATTQSNKADRMAAGSKKGLETFKKKTDEACWDSHKQVGMKKKGNKMVPNCVPKNEANTPVGQRDKMKIIDRKPHPDGGHIVTMQTKTGKTIKRHLKNGKVKDMTEAYSMKEMVCKSCGDTYGKPTNEACMYDAYDMAGENWCSRKEYMTAQKKNESVNEISKKTAQSYLDKTRGDDAFSGTRKANNRLKGAINAVGKLRKKESVESIEELTAAEKKLVNQMYDKKGNLTPLGKKVMNHGKKPRDKGYVENTNEEVELDEDRRTELHHQSMMFTHAMKQAEFKSQDPRLAKQHDVAGKLHAKAADMHVDNHPDAKKHSDKANKASKLLGEEVELVNEVLDTPGAMDRYHNKAKAQSDRARNSATAKIVRGNKDISKEKDIIRRREKGMDMATNVRAKQFRKAVTKKPYGEATTKVAKVSDSDREKLLKIRKMLNKEKKK